VNPAPAAANPDVLANRAAAVIPAVAIPEFAADVGHAAASPELAGVTLAVAAVPPVAVIPVPAVAIPACAVASPDAVAIQGRASQASAVASLANGVARSRHRLGARVRRVVVRRRRTIVAVKVVRVALPGRTGHGECRRAPTTPATAKACPAHPVAAAARRRDGGRGTTKPDRYPQIADFLPPETGQKVGYLRALIRMRWG
jgi:hypothetical protein